MKHTKILIIICCILIAGMVPFYIFTFDSAVLFRDFGYLLFPTLTVIAGLFTLKTYGLKNEHGKAFLWIVLGFLGWLIGEFLWDYFKHILDTDPYPSLADVFFLLSYLSIGIGIIMEARSAHLTNFSFRKSISWRHMTLFGVLGFFVVYFGVYKTYNANSSHLENAISMLYGLVDLIFIAVTYYTSVLVRAYKGGKFSAFWRVMLVGFFLFLAADLIFAMFRDQYSNDVTPYVYIDFLWIIGYCIWACGFGYLGFSIRDIQEKVKKSLSASIEK